MANEFDFIKDEEGVEAIQTEKQKKDMLVISREDFIEVTSNVSKRMLEEMAETAKENGKELSPLMVMSETLTHIALLSRIARELFKEGE